MHGQKGYMQKIILAHIDFLKSVVHFLPNSESMYYVILWLLLSILTFQNSRIFFMNDSFLNKPIVNCFKVEKNCFSALSQFLLIQADRHIT